MLSIVILAAGQGKRMQSDLPKVLQPLAGQPLLQHVVTTAKSLDPRAIHVIYGHGGDLVRSALRTAPVDAWILQAEQRGTGHAMRQALPALQDGDLVLVLYGDVPLITASTLQALIERAGHDAIGLLTVMLRDPSGYGRILRDDVGRALAIVEDKDATAEQRQIREGNTGVMAVPVAHLRRWLTALKSDNAQGEFYLTDIIAMAVADGVEVHPLCITDEAEALGVNDKLQLAQVEAHYRHRAAQRLMLAGATVVDPARIDVRGDVQVGRDVLLDVNVILEGRVVLGDRVAVGAGCVLRDCEIAADAVIHPHCVIEQARVGAAARIGPFARLRPGADLAADVHIGNFVEIKNSRMEPGAKANHLAYVGDATVGARANIGAGTIVANYDGAQKHHTTIGDDAHTGSNSVLVAPIVVGEGATIGAGSTVTKDVPPGGLTVARARQISLPAWKRPKKSAQ
jgi:bifunctional UDP-N-acetylglucosamine pyrophosphorylase/glucosamine-1-phosphate N-acetyltransferase